jgi:glycosyltransferase involved in cell wall biosynthesis
VKFETPISIIIPTYRNPKCLDICLQSAIEQQSNNNEIIVIVDGYGDESELVLNKHKKSIRVLNLKNNMGMQYALNLGVMNANNEIVLIVNDDNVFGKSFDVSVLKTLTRKSVLTINQIEPSGPGIFNFHVKNLGTTPDEFKYDEFISYEQSISVNKTTKEGGIFPFAIFKKQYMIVGGFDMLYSSPFICDWDFFLKLDLNGIRFTRTYASHLYHFGGAASPKIKEYDKLKLTEQPAAELFYYKWGIRPQIYKDLSHNPKHNRVISGIRYK